MNLRDPDSMNAVVGNLLRYGVVLSGVVILVGVLRLVSSNAYSDTGAFLTYDPNSIPHGTFNVSLQGLVSGLPVLDPVSVIELGVILLIATPVMRVFVSILLFQVEGDRLYAIVTAIVLVLLLFSMLVTPFIPGFHA